MLKLKVHLITEQKYRLTSHEEISPLSKKLKKKKINKEDFLLLLTQVRNEKEEGIEPKDQIPPPIKATHGRNLK